MKIPERQVKRIQLHLERFSFEIFKDLQSGLIFCLMVSNLEKDTFMIIGLFFFSFWIAALRLMTWSQCYFVFIVSPAGRNSRCNRNTTFIECKPDFGTFTSFFPAHFNSSVINDPCFLDCDNSDEEWLLFLLQRNYQFNLFASVIWYGNHVSSIISNWNVFKWRNQLWYRFSQFSHLLRFILQDENQSVYIGRSPGGCFLL